MNKLLLLTSMCAFTAASLWAQPSVQQRSAAEAGNLFSNQEAVAPSAAVEQAQASKSLVKSLANGSKIVYSRNSNGTVAKQLVKPLASQNVTSLQASKQTAAKAGAAKASSSNYTLLESFEYWNGTDDDWIPTNWSRVVSADTLKTYNGNCTWHVSGATLFGPSPAAGMYMAVVNAAIQYDDSYQVHAYPQDEWLISPEFTPKANEKLIFTAGYSPFFLFDVTNGVDWSTMSFTKKQVSATLQVLVKADGGEWKKVFDIYDSYKDYTFQELFNDFTDVANYTHTVSLADYTGKKVQVAFRYVGSDGNVISVDLVKVAVPHPTSAYTRPEGAFYFGFSDDYRFVSDSKQRSLMLIPAYVDQSWTNESNGESESFTWKYDKQDGSSTTSDVPDLTVNYKRNYNSQYNWFNVPTLTASAEGAADSTYQWNGLAIQAGGEALYTGSDGNTVYYGVGNYDINNKFYALTSGGKGLYGYCDGIDDVWTSLFGVAKAHVYALGNLFEKPATPYRLKKVSVQGTGSFKDEAELHAYVIRVKNGSLADTIATAKCKGSEVVTTTISSQPYVSIPFTFVDAQGNASPVLIDDEIIVVMDNFDNSNTTQFTAYQSGPDPFKETNGYFFVSRTDTAGNVTNALHSLAVLSTSAGKCYSSFLFNLYADYGWFSLVDDNVQYNEEGEVNVEFGAESSSKTFNVEASDAASEWTVTFDTDDRQAPAWLVEKHADNKLSTDVIDGRGTVTFTASSLPEGTDERATTAYVGNAAGGQYQFNITQSRSSGVGSISTSVLSVANVGGDFAVSAPASVKSVSVYSVSGQLLKAVAVNGYTTLGIGSYAHGAYMLRFSNGKTLKVVK